MHAFHHIPININDKLVYWEVLSTQIIFKSTKICLYLMFHQQHWTRVYISTNPLKMKLHKMKFENFKQNLVNKLISVFKLTSTSSKFLKRNPFLPSVKLTVLHNKEQSNIHYLIHDLSIHFLHQIHFLNLN